MALKKRFFGSLVNVFAQFNSMSLKGEKIKKKKLKHLFVV